MSWPPGTSVGSSPPPPSTTSGSRLAREAYSAAVSPAGPEPRITTLYRLCLGIAPFYKAPSPGGEAPDRAIVRAMAGQGPTRIGRYEIRQELGRGMMGIVYL